MTDKTGLASRLTEILSARGQEPLTVTVNGGHTIEIIWQTPVAEGLQIIYRSVPDQGELYAGIYYPQRKQMSPRPEEETEHILSLLEQLLFPMKETSPELSGETKPAPFNPEISSAPFNPEIDSVPVNSEIDSASLNLKSGSRADETLLLSKILEKAKDAERAGQWLEAAQAYEIALSTGRIAGNLTKKLEYDCGECFLKGGRPERAYPHLVQAAEMGCRPAQVLLGDMYYNGANGCDKDRKEAARWYELAAEQGDAGAGYMLGELYCESTAPEGMDLQKAFQWYLTAAKGGDKRAQYKLGVFYRNDRRRGKLPAKPPVPKDLMEAFHWLKLSAEQNYMPAQDDLADLLCSDEAPFGKDLNEAFVWYERASEQGSYTAKIAISKMYYDGTAPSGRNLREAFLWMERAAKYGCHEAQLALGKMYMNGDGTPVDDSKALHWYQEAAKYNNPEALYLCGAFLSLGRGAKEDPVTGAKYFRKAAEKGNPQACFYYGTDLYYGRNGIEKDEKKGLEYLHKGAEANDPAAQFRLGRIAWQDPGKKGNADTALYWFARASGNGHPDAPYFCGELQRRKLVHSLTHQQALDYYKLAIKRKSRYAGSACFWYGAFCYEGTGGVQQDYAEAMTYFRQGEKLGHTDCFRMIGEMYYRGHGVEKDYSIACQQYKKASEKGDYISFYLLGRMYFNGQGVAEDKNQALEYFKKSAELGYPKAAGHIALMYFSGDGVKKDKKLALQYAEPAIEDAGKFTADPLAQYVYGFLCYYGFRGFPKDQTKGLEYLRRAADGGISSAQYFYGSFLFAGKGIPEDQEKGAEYIHKAAEQGHSTAKRMIKLLDL